MKPYSVFEKKEMQEGKFYLGCYRSCSTETTIEATIETIKGGIDSKGGIFSLYDNYTNFTDIYYEFDSLEDLARNMDACLEDSKKYFPEAGK